jgi:hypothetical protein
VTDKQSKFYYFPAWGRVVDAHDWRMAKGRLVGKRQDRHGLEETTGLYQMVWDAAELVARKEARAVRPDDLRHGCHLVALAKDKSSADFSNAELDRVVTLFRVLTDPDDLDAIMAWCNPEIRERERMLWFIRERCVEGYVRSICNQIYGTDDYASFTPETLRELVMTLKHRPKALKPRPGSVPARTLQPGQDAPQLKPINLAKERQARLDKEAAETAAEFAGVEKGGDPW